ncbi:MAG: CBS domain-containing protein [Parvularculaceae bacterium]
MPVSDVMSKNLFVVAPQSTLATAALLMKERDIGAMPVADGNQLVGIVTDRDIALRCGAEGCVPAEARVSQAMTKDVYYCRVSDPLEKVAAFMGEMQVRRLPVIDEETRIVGMVTIGDIARKSKADAASAFRLISQSSARPS